MKLSDLCQNLISVPAGAENLTIGGLTADSRKVVPGFLFAALAGTRADGSAYIEEAVSRGAIAVLTAEGADVSPGIVHIRAKDPRHVLAIMAARFHERQPQTIVAVTGTSGKTSVAAFTRQIWQTAGNAAASIGTTGVRSPTRDDYGTLTTPDPVDLALLLRELADEGVTHAAMEASSHGLTQRRLDGVRLAAGGFTNLGRDHMDYHPTVEHYFESKMRLFDTLLPKTAPAVVFADDQWSAAAIDAASRAGLNVHTVGRNGNLLKLKRLEHERHRQIGEIEAEGRLFRIVLPLAGEFQMANALVAAGLAIASGTPVQTALAALEHLQGAPGRLDLAGTARGGVPVFVDYAHKPEALENVLASVRPFTTGKVIVVFGCGGDRDKLKRPIMGEIATRLADVVIVTDDNPRSEVAEVIRAEILAAAPGALEIGDRRTAIRQAVAAAEAGDTVIVAGKGHEIGQTIGTQTQHFSDIEEVRAAISEIGQ
ncbi:UDP-N-acetylmuramoyl-L-alanyl-D-glutamate--2,6-diaminopimelate ligase [Aureimonas fodinaquatilis]|uniref:UDP-N-acetylmuramoyl-L-alanyl-D-glutamate--2,6-diaminopimelate ligase n=1 Tax=Aureimonas fodinaquatilis TaxID=2565783 RepID=A0A5B0E1P8_9HYPH|nr:UDP-N-acetylmuramoyl-L-alanyl-D-glutamate--2,6-diaminopimelate ligase [Aureimonas fodinaquatilis]KAA0972578.1 UDP-N-acetylmuramoyl-L-alanyl-D-glutamate--2,6-diaminopimelate ligase [Aureimonas fodinaquatilis]